LRPALGTPHQLVQRHGRGDHGGGYFEWNLAVKNIEQRPCPFCGAPDNQLFVESVTGGYQTHCTNCLAQAPTDKWGQRTGNVYDELVEALEAMKQLIDVALPCFNWGASALSAEAITLLNEVPGKVDDALAKARGGVL
jgi:hypothetical protein